jgi:photosystem II stability/assembly factor-like uncharacterized protein
VVARHRIPTLRSARPINLRTAAFLLALVTLGGMRLAGDVGGSFEGLDPRRGELELEGAMSPSGDWLAAQRAGESGVVTARQYERALAQAQALREETARIAPELFDAPWSQMGPTNIGGRVSDVAVVPGGPLTGVAIVNPPIFAATATGGVWGSGDFGATWTYKWDPAITQSTGAIAIGSNGTIFVGTGEANPGGGSVTWGGTGVYRSKDLGATWQYVGLGTSGAIGRIVIDPDDPDRVFVAATGNLFRPGGERGLYRSVDGGDTWERVLAGANATTGAADVALDPSTGRILVGMWDHHRLPTHRMYAGPGSGVYLSEDGGDTFSRAELPGAPAPQQVGRIGVAFGNVPGADPGEVALPESSTAYAVIANNLAGSGVGLWRSTNDGDTWTKTSAPAGSLSQSSFGWWFGRVFVDPADDRHIFVPGVSLVESTDSGDSFASATGGAHADQHAMAWDPSVDGRVYLGNDGGMWRSDLNGAGGSWVPAAVQGWTQHYSVDVSEQSPNRIVTGLQDNGCQRNYVAGNAATSTVYNTMAGCGDGLQTLINPVDENVVYGCSQYGSCSRSTIGGGPAGGSSIGATTSSRRGWWVPLQFDPSNPSVMYYAGDTLNRSTNGGQSWTAISGDLTTDPPQQDPNNGYKIFGTITTVAAAKTDGNVIYVGTDDGLLWRTTDLGGSWTRLEDPDDPKTPQDENDLPGSWVTRVAVDPQNADIAYATFSGFRSDVATPHVVKTTDGGRSWTNISGSLPAAPVNEIVVIPGGKLAVGTDVGVFLTSDGGATWLAAGSSMPAVPVLDLRYHQGSNTLTAATFGHGIQRLALP